MTCGTCKGTGKIPLLGAVTAPCPDCGARRWRVTKRFPLPFDRPYLLSRGGTLTLEEDPPTLAYDPPGDGPEVLWVRRGGDFEALCDWLDDIERTERQ